MRRLKKAFLLPIRKVSYALNLLKIYYWADRQLSDLWRVTVLPMVYYHGLYHMSMWLSDHGACRRLADRVIHTIPYYIRFEIS